MGIQEEYAAIAQGMKNGTLPPLGEDTKPHLWVTDRFANSSLSTSGPGLAPGFGEQFNARLRSSTAYSFGNCSRKDAAKVYVSQELSKGEDISPGPLAYKIPTNMGPDGAAKTVVERSPMILFGTDIKNSAELRELKACGVFEGTTVAGELRQRRRGGVNAPWNRAPMTAAPMSASSNAPHCCLAPARLCCFSHLVVVSLGSCVCR